MTTATLLFDPTDPQLRRDPYPTYLRMREESPAWLSPDGIWYFTRYQYCCDLFRNPALSYDATAARSYQRQLSTDPEERARQLEDVRKSRSLLDVDPPEHTRLRSLIHRAFTAPTVEASRPLIVSWVDRLMDDFEGGSVELVSEFASMLPILVICNMLGIPTEERHEFLAIGNASSRSVDPDVPVSEKLANSRRQRAYISRLIEERRKAPADDLMSRLIDAADDGRIAEDELVVNTGAVLIAGFETTTNLITNAIYRLLQYPEQLALLRAEPELIGNTVEETLRFDPPAQFMRPRTIIADCEIGGAELHPGDPVVPLIAAANRDPEEFDHPETYDVARRVNRHLSFGVGHHLCIGSSLARMEAQEAILRLVQRYPNLAVSTEEPPEYRPNLQLRGFSKLVLTL
jgi:cytochrome P450